MHSFGELVSQIAIGKEGVCQNPYTVRGCVIVLDPPACKFALVLTAHFFWLSPSSCSTSSFALSSPTRTQPSPAQCAFRRSGEPAVRRSGALLKCQPVGVRVLETTVLFISLLRLPQGKFHQIICCQIPSNSIEPPLDVLIHLRKGSSLHHRHYSCQDKTDCC